jgi:hypothetical protein
LNSIIKLSSFTIGYRGVSNALDFAKTIKTLGPTFVRRNSWTDIINMLVLGCQIQQYEETDQRENVDRKVDKWIE